MGDWQPTVDLFRGLLKGPEPDIELARAAFLISTLEYPELDMGQELAVIDALATGARRRLGNSGSTGSFSDDPLFCLNTLSEYLFDEVGFQGNQENYYDPRNSFLNEVLRRRLGIPISLAVVYIEVGKRLGIPIIGIGMPGHFLVRHRDQEDHFLDPFHKGILLTPEECAERLERLVQTDFIWDPRQLDPVGNREILSRVLRNLKGIYQQSQEYPKLLKVEDLLVALQPARPQERRDRGLVHFVLEHWQDAREDLEFFLDYTVPGEDTLGISRVLEAISKIQRPGGGAGR